MDMSYKTTSYNHKSIESYWQNVWAQEQSSHNRVYKGKKYILDMFPYPSGAGLHVGHPRGYIGTDVLSRYYRSCGYEVLHPMGWDSFGLPAENYAIKTGVHPALSTKENIENYRRQLKMIGLSYDWKNEFATSDPSYYKWTQWMFGLLYKKGLAYRKAAKVNWCPGCQTVLANEQVKEGKCERSNDIVEQKNLEQWFFKITDYAERLLNDLDELDWPESIRQAQKNWIGKSIGHEIEFESHAGSITVFTTRLETLFGVTYIVLAPEHSLVEALTAETSKESVNKYREYVKKRTDLQRQEDQEKKTGVFLGSYAIHPLTKNKIPIWISDYVLQDYGTGAVMAVPAHDERDYFFASTFSLPIQEVIDGVEKLPRIGEGTMIYSDFVNGLSCKEAREKIALRCNAKSKVTYRLRDWLVSRQRYWGCPIPIMYDERGNTHLVPESDLPVVLPNDVDFKPTGESPLKRSSTFHTILEKKGWRRESDTMDTFVCSSWYFLRFVDPHNVTAPFNKDKVNAWLPVDVYVGGAEHAVLHLLFSRFFTKVLYDYGFISFKEPFLKLRNQGLIIAEDGRKMSKSHGNVVNPDEVVNEVGADTFRVYEMFMGPFEDAMPWSTKNIIGSRRFIEKVWKVLVQTPSSKTAPHVKTTIHKTIQKVTNDIENFQFNTAISALMICTNEIARTSGIEVEDKMIMCQLLYPFAPHVSSEIWKLLGMTEDIAYASWPRPDAEYLQESTVTIAIQVNGKTKGKVTIAKDATQEDAVEEAQKFLGKKPINYRSIVFVPNRIINFII